MSEAIPAVELRIADNAAEASAGLLLLTTVLDKLGNVVSNGLGLGNVADGLTKLSTAVKDAVPEDSVKRLERMADALERLEGVGGIDLAVDGIDTGTVEAINTAATQQAADGIQAVSDAVENLVTAGQAEDTAAHQVNDAVSSMIPAHLQVEDSVKKATDALVSEKDAMNSAEKGSETLTDRLRELFNATDNTRKSHNGLLSSLARIAKYRALRWVIKQITEGFSEGVSNVREYSKAIGSSFSTAMDTAQNTLLTLKNSIGAAVAPIIEALIPTLQTVVSWIITAVNWVNQLLSLLSGKSSWTKAIDSTSGSLDNVSNSADGASKSIKNLLADWDELNVIQSSTSSGSGSSGLTDTTTYQKMFTQVYTFEDRIRKVANFISNKMDDIKDIAVLVGTAIAAWKISNNLRGFLSTLTGLIAAGAIIALEFKLSSTLTDEYLDTGNPGWLIADAIQTAVGTGLAAILVKKFLGGNAMAWTIPLSLTISAIAGIKTLLGKKDVSALSKESVTVALLNAAKVGTAVGYGLFKFSSLTAGLAVAGGAGAALMTFGAVVGIKAIADAVASDDFKSEEHVAEAIVSSVSMGAGTGILAAATGYGIGSITAATGAALITFGVVTGVQAVIEDVKSNETKMSLGKYVAASLSAGLGTTITVAMLTSGAWGTALLAGGAVGLIGLGVLIAVSTKLQAKKAFGITWGDRKLTQDEIQAYVSTQMFNIDVKTSVSVIAERVEGVQTKRAQVREALTKAIGTMNVIRLGVAKAEDYTNLKGEVDAVIETVDGYVEEAKGLGKLTLQFTPQLLGGDAKDASEWFGQYTTGWDKVDEWVKAQGKKIGAQLVENEAGEIVAKEPEVLAALMQQLTDVTSAISGAQINATAFSNMKFALGDLTEASFEDVMKAFNDYKEELRAAYSQLVKEQYVTQQELVAALFVIDPESQEYKDALKKLQYMEEHMIEAVDEAVDKAAGPGYQTILDEYLQAQFTRVNRNGLKVPTNIQATINDALLKGLSMEDALRKVVEESSGISAEALKAMGNANWWNLLSDNVREQIVNVYRNAFGDEYINELKRSGIDYNPAKAITEAFDEAEQIDWKPYGEYITEQYEKTVEFKNEVESLGGMDVTVKPPETKEFEDKIDRLNESTGMTIESLTTFFDTTQLDTSLKETSSTVTGLTENIETLNSTEVKAAAADMSPIDNPIEGTIQKLLYLQELYYSIPAWNRDVAPELKYHGSNSRYNVRMYASGGFPETGSMFIANEAGPEMVGTINGKTAVANNDQIVAGVASGVAAGQAEQNSLLRQQNDYLRALLNKESTVKVEPSSAWGKFNRRSEALYAKTTG